MTLEGLEKEVCFVGELCSLPVRCEDARFGDRVIWSGESWERTHSSELTFARGAGSLEALGLGAAFFFELATTGSGLRFFGAGALTLVLQARGETESGVKKRLAYQAVLS